MEPIIRCRLQIVSCASAKITLNNGILVHRLTNIPRLSKVGRIQGLRQLEPPLDPPLVNKDNLK